MKSYAPIFLRSVIGLYLYSAIKAKVFLPSVIAKFSDQLAKLSFPAPLLLAYVGTWMLFISYVLILVGYRTKLAAVPMVIYFSVAILTYHLPEGHSIRETMPAFVLMVLGCFFYLNGAGKPSFDEGI